MRTRCNELNATSLDDLISHIANSQLTGECIIIKNDCNQFVYISDTQYKKMGFRCEREWLLKTDADMLCEFRSASEKLEKAFNNSKAGKSGNTLHVAGYSSGITIEECHASPIIIEGKFCGEFSIAARIDARPSRFFDALSDRFGHNFCYDVCIPNNISPIKHLILFLLVIGFSQAEITYIMNKYLGIFLSVNTIKYHLRDLIEQFEVKTMHQLVEAALAAKIHQTVPPELVANGCFLLP